MEEIAFDLKIEKVESFRTDISRLWIKPPFIKNIKPGQFLMINCYNDDGFHLKRPFSISEIKDDAIALLVKAVGEGSRVLLSKKAGERIEVLGPLGNGFTVDPGKSALLVGGGMGSAPLPFLAREIVENGGRVKFLLGSSKASDLVNLDVIRQYSDQIAIYTEDGSLGEKGLVTAGWTSALENVDYICACGPTGMLKALSGLPRNNLPMQVSLEQRMACGYGACYGCVQPVQREGLLLHERVCKEGPVFMADEVVW